MCHHINYTDSILAILPRGEPPAPTALIKGVMMIIEVIREEQRKYYASFKKLANNPKTKPEAVRVAQSRLRSAGILDKAGKLANPYR